MLLEEIFGELKNRHLVSSKADFSRRFLKLADNYFCLQGQKSRPSEATLVYLMRSLDAHAQRDLQARVLASLLKGDQPCR